VVKRFLLDQSSVQRFGCGQGLPQAFSDETLRPPDHAAGDFRLIPIDFFDVSNTVRTATIQRRLA